MASAAPSAASDRAMARPIPRDAPVTTATFPARRAPSVADALISGPLLMRCSVAHHGHLYRGAQDVSVRLDRAAGVKRRDPDELRGEATRRSVIARVGAPGCGTYTGDKSSGPIRRNARRRFDSS